MRKTPLGPAWWVVFVAVLASLLFAVTLGFRTGGYLLTATLVFAAVLRGALPERIAAGLVVRGRPWDVVMYLLMALAVGLMFYLVKLPA